MRKRRRYGMQIILSDDRNENESDHSDFSSDGADDDAEDHDGNSSEEEMREFKIRQVNILPEVRRAMQFKSVFVHPDTNDHLLDESSLADVDDQGVLPSAFDPEQIRDRYEMLVLRQEIGPFKKKEE